MSATRFTKATSSKPPPIPPAASPSRTARRSTSLPARVSLNDYTYDVAGAPNNALFTLVEGTFAFVAGQVAHSGDGMKITTPVATMGIRGTVGLFKSEATVVNSRLGHVWSVVLHEDLDGSHHLGRIAIIDQDPTSATFGQIIYLLDSSEYIAYLEPQGSGLPPHVRVEPITSSRQFDDRHFYDDLNQIISAYNGANPRSGPNGGSGDNPNLLLPQQPNQENGGQPLPINFQPNSSGEGPNTTLESFSVPVQGGILPNNSTPTTPAPLSTIFIWNSSGPSDWPTDPNWNTGSAPDLPIDQVIIQSGTVNYDLPGNTAVSALTVDPGAILDVTSGQLTTGNLVDDGTIVVEGDPPTLVIAGPATIGSTHSIEAVGTGSTVDFEDSTVDNQGIIAARQGGTVDLNEEAITNESGARSRPGIFIPWSISLTPISIILAPSLQSMAARCCSRAARFSTKLPRPISLRPRSWRAAAGRRLI